MVSKNILVIPSYISHVNSILPIIKYLKDNKNNIIFGGPEFGWNGSNLKNYICELGYIYKEIDLQKENTRFGKSQGSLQNIRKILKNISSIKFYQKNFQKKKLI